eukprot:TRINITY_DN9202_c0_g2_i1.p1 TRINITY_DN9202_c0_g2~~TRINITY_DN9202_c0_g2_i1.p1  ORF type:complete len:148 (+),score=36.35 TRINITY_DN9202_c0_g2_i1:120-563(+)
MAMSEQQKRENFLLFSRAEGDQISAVDIGTAMSACGYAPSEAEIAGMKAEADPSNSGGPTVDFSMFNGWLSKLKPRPTEVDLKEAFSVFDKDGEGKVSVSEMRYVLVFFFKQKTAYEIEDVLRRITRCGPENTMFMYADFVKVMMAK